MNKKYKYFLENEKEAIKNIYESHKSNISYSNEESYILNYIVNHEKWTENKYNGIDGIRLLESICIYCDQCGYDLDYKSNNTEQLTAPEIILLNTFKSMHIHEHVTYCKTKGLDYKKSSKNFHAIALDAKFKIYLENHIRYLNDVNSSLLKFDKESIEKRVTGEGKILTNTIYITQIEDLLERLDIKY